MKIENFETKANTMCKISVLLPIFKAKKFCPHEMENNDLCFKLGKFWKCELFPTEN